MSHDDVLVGMIIRSTDGRGRSLSASSLQLSLSIGQAVYPDDGMDAEQLLAEADRRMYMEKQQQPSRKNRRGQPRTVCRLTVTFQPEGSTVPILGNLSNISLSGCYIETAALLQTGQRVHVFYSTDDDTLENVGTVARGRCQNHRTFVDGGSRFATT